jgi:hypothetical protein
MKKMNTQSWPEQNKDNDTKELSEAHKNTLKKVIFQEITENFMEKILDMVNQNVQCTQEISRHQK